MCVICQLVGGLCKLVWTSLLTLDRFAPRAASWLSLRLTCPAACPMPADRLQSLAAPRPPSRTPLR